MTRIDLSSLHLNHYKSVLRSLLPAVGHAHMLEGFSAGLGFGSWIALRTSLDTLPNNAAMKVPFSTPAICARLLELGYTLDQLGRLDQFLSELKPGPTLTAAPPLCSYWEEEGGYYGGIFTPRDGSSPRVLIYDLDHILIVKKAVELRYIDGATSLDNGAHNTRQILLAGPENEEAREIATRLTHLTVDGKRHFYWPSILELTHLFVVAEGHIADAIFDKTKAFWYALSSSRHTKDNRPAQAFDFANGHQYCPTILMDMSIIPIRSRLIVS